MIKKGKVVVAILLISILANIGLSYQLSCTTPKFAKVDVERLITKLVKDVSVKSLSEDESTKYSKEYIKKLDDLLIEISKQENLVIVPSKAVIAGAIDITEQVDELMRGTDVK